MFAFSLFAQNTQSNSFTYTDSVNNYNIKFPAKYTITNNSSVNTQHKGIECNKDGNVYFFKQTLHKHKFNKSEKKHLAIVALDGFAQVMKGEITSKNEITYKQFQGIKSTVVIPEKKMTAQYKVLVDKHIQYELIVVFNKTEAPAEVKKFFDSFQP